MAPSLRMPFPSLSGDDLFSRGVAGHVFRINPNIVLKCPTKFDNALHQQSEELEASGKEIEFEKAIYRVLMEQPHPNIVQCILCVSEGIFMRGMESTLQERLSQAGTATVPVPTQERWVLQLTSAVARLERLGFLGDFDATVEPGAELVVASEAFTKMDEDFLTPPAGPVTEKFSLASCVYTIRFGHWPWHELDPPTRSRKMIRNEFPPVSVDPLFGDMTRRCWHVEYASTAAVEHDVLSRLGRSVAQHEALRLAALEDLAVRYPLPRDECEVFLASQAEGRSC